MSRLIDADELKELVQGSDNLIDLQKEEICICIDACDTAYDVDKVVEQLKAESLECLGISEGKYEMDKAEYDSYCSLNLFDVYRIVKAGGVNE